jgi:hypothetical protein
MTITKLQSGFSPTRAMRIAGGLNGGNVDQNFVYERGMTSVKLTNAAPPPASNPGVAQMHVATEGAGPGGLLPITNWDYKAATKTIEFLGGPPQVRLPNGKVQLLKPGESFFVNYNS